MAKLNTLSRRLATIGGVRLSIVAFFPTDKTIVDVKYYKDTESQNVTLNFPSYIRFELPYIPEFTNNKRWLNLTYMGKIQMISTMETMLSHINTKEVFVNDPELGLTVTKELDKSGRSAWNVYELIGETGILIYPTVIHEQDNFAAYKGIGIILNSPINKVEMSIAEFICLYRFLKEIDIWSLTQAMFNSALMLAGVQAIYRDLAPVEAKIDSREDSIQPRRRTNFEQWKKDRADKLKQEAEAGETPESDGS